MLTIFEQQQVIKTKTEPLTLYEELYLITPIWADKIFKKNDYTDLDVASKCVLGSAYGFTINYMYGNDKYCMKCTNFSYDIFRFSNHEHVQSKRNPYKEDKFYAEISKFVNHWKEEHCL